MFAAAIAKAEMLVSEPRLVGERWAVTGPGFSLWTDGLDIEAPVAFSLDERLTKKTRKTLDAAVAARMEWVAIIALYVKFSETRDPLHAYAAAATVSGWPSAFSDESRSGLGYILLEALNMAVRDLSMAYAYSQVMREDSAAA